MMKRRLANLLFLLLLVYCPLSSLAAEVVFYDTDNVGTPVAMWDKDGKKVWEGEYYPFGEEFRVSESPSANNKHFVGKEKDEETGLTYFGARSLDGTTGRFIAPDPVRAVDPFTSKTNSEILNNPQRLNRYVYGLNNPYRYVDPDGEFAITTDSPEIDEIKAEAHKVSQASIRNVKIVVDLATAVASEGMIQGGITSKGGIGKAMGRTGKQARLKELGKDPNVSSADRGWIKQDMNQIQRGIRKNIRVPPGKNMAHKRGLEAKKGYGYEHSDLQDIDLHKSQHKHEGY